jgi:hypothetical protein
VSVDAAVSGRASRSCLLDVIMGVAARPQPTPMRQRERCEGATEKSVGARVTLCPSCGTVRSAWERSPMRQRERCEGATEKSVGARVTLCPSCGTVRSAWERSHVT